MKQQEKIKYQISKIKETVKKSNIFDILLVSFIFTILFLNLISSQFISPIYFGLVNNDKNSTITFIQKIKDLPEYQKILEMNNNIYGPTVKEVIFKQENRKKEMINNLEQQLIINPKARDILYSLYQLYLAEGEKNQANDYLRQAKEVDPSINPINTTNVTNPTNK